MNIVEIMYSLQFDIIHDHFPFVYSLDPSGPTPEVKGVHIKILRTHFLLDVALLLIIPFILIYNLTTKQINVLLCKVII